MHVFVKYANLIDNMEEIHIALQAEKIFQFWGIPITNTLITTWVVVLLLAVLGFFVGRNIKLIPKVGNILHPFCHAIPQLLGWH